MRGLIRVFAILLLFAPAPAMADNPAMVRNAINGFILAGYERLAGEAELQSATLDALCAAPGAEPLATARQQFAALVTAWSEIEVVRFGPILTDNRLDRILFWPDRKSTGLKQVQRLLAGDDLEGLDLNALRKKSVALQGLGALEFTLFGTGAESLETPKGKARCTYARLVADAITKTAEETANDWLDPDGIAKRMVHPAPEWPDYRTHTEVLQELLGVWVHGTELIRDTRIKPFFADTVEASNHKAALFWRSNLTIPAIRGNAKGLRDLFVVSGLADDLSDANRWAAGALIFEFDNFDRTTREITLPIAEAIVDQHARSKIRYLLILTRSLQKLTIHQIAAEFDLTLGFSALDGD